MFRFYIYCCTATQTVILLYIKDEWFCDYLSCSASTLAIKNIITMEKMLF